MMMLVLMMIVISVLVQSISDGAFYIALHLLSLSLPQHLHPSLVVTQSCKTSWEDMKDTRKGDWGGFLTSSLEQIQISCKEWWEWTSRRRRSRETKSSDVERERERGKETRCDNKIDPEKDEGGLLLSPLFAMRVKQGRRKNFSFLSLSFCVFNGQDTWGESREEFLRLSLLLSHPRKLIAFNSSHSRSLYFAALLSKMVLLFQPLLLPLSFRLSIRLYHLISSFSFLREQ